MCRSELSLQQRASACLLGYRQDTWILAPPSQEPNDRNNKRPRDEGAVEDEGDAASEDSPASEDPPASDPPASEDPPGPDDNGDPEAPAADATAAAAAAIPVDLARSWPLVTIEEQLLAIAPHVWRKHFRHCYELYKAVAIGVSPSTHGVVLCIDEWFSNRNFPDYIIEATNMFLMKELSEDPYNLRCATGGTSHQCLRSLVLSLFVRKTGSSA